LVTVEDSRHFPLFGEESDDYWMTLPPPGGGFTVLGPDKRIFSVTMFHEVESLLKNINAAEV
jgi:hypothetical protein